MAGITKIGNAHGYIINEGDKISIDGELYYRGYNIVDLIHGFTTEGRYGFEETACLLFFGDLPTKSSSRTSIPCSILIDFCRRASRKT